MSWLNNLKISIKVGLIVALLACVVIGSVSYAAVRMKSIDDNYSDLVSRVSAATTASVRAARQRRIAILPPPTNLLRKTLPPATPNCSPKRWRIGKNSKSRMAQVLKQLPEKATIIEPVLAGFQKTFGACSPVINLRQRLRQLKSR